jgi:hypothetical protein
MIPNLFISVSPQVSDILSEFPDLMDGFNDVMAWRGSLGESLIWAKLPYVFLSLPKVIRPMCVGPLEYLLGYWPLLVCQKRAFKSDMHL